ncbi:MAG: hypothetical protein KAQ85_01660 [Thermodesulfovibrionia bacterium]|nr:hypothetical protein [Thermodesulfovibrionia bacterium]
MKAQIKFVAVNPKGDICGPVGDSREFVREALIIGYRRAGHVVTHNRNDDEIFDVIVHAGYSIRKAKIKII